MSAAQSPLIHGGDVAARQLAAERVEVVFTLTGGHLSPLFDGCWKQGIRLVDVRHEQSAAHAADAWARLTRRAGVAAVTAGPGLTGAITGIANAFYSQSPVVLLAGRNPLSMDGMGSLQDAPQVDLLRPVTKQAQTALSAWRLPEVLSHAFTAALSPRFGPALVDLPFDVLMTRLPADEAPPVTGWRFTHGAGVDPDAVLQVARWLAEAKRPVLFSGSGAYWAGAGEELRQLATTARLPLYVNGLARGLVPTGCDQLLSLTRREALAGADLILILGADFDFRLAYGRSPAFAADARVVQVDPQPDRIGRNRRVDLGLVCDVTAFLRALLDHSGYGARPCDWLTGLREREAQKWAKRRPMLESDRSPIHPLRFAAEVARFADPDAVFIGDGGDIVSETSAVVRVDRPGHWLDPGPFGCLGVGAPFALGARLARPDKQVLVIFGDGAFGFNAFEYDSAVRQKLPFVGVIGNDGAWGEMRTFHEEVFGPDHLESQYLCRETRYEKVVEALGGYGERVERPEDIAPALRRAQDAGVPAVVNVLLDPTYRRTGGTVSGAEVAALFGGGDPNAYRHQPQGDKS